jgi:hypothetical protein
MRSAVGRCRHSRRSEGDFELVPPDMAMPQGEGKTEESLGRAPEGALPR